MGPGRPAPALSRLTAQTPGPPHPARPWSPRGCQRGPGQHSQGRLPDCETAGHPPTPPPPVRIGPGGKDTIPESPGGLGDQMWSEAEPPIAARCTPNSPPQPQGGDARVTAGGTRGVIYNHLLSNRHAIFSNN